MSWGFSGLNLSPFLFPLLAPCLSHIIYPGQILCFHRFHRTTPHEKKFQAGKKEYRMKPDLTHRVTPCLHTLEPDMVQDRPGQDINDPLLLINPQAANLNMDIHMKGFI